MSREMKKEKIEQKKYRANNRVNLTYLKYQDRRKVGKKSSGKKIEEFDRCPYCQSFDGYYVEELTETLSRRNYGFNHRPDEEYPEQKVSNLIWENQNYICSNCGKAISEVEKIS